MLSGAMVTGCAYSLSHTERFILVDDGVVGACALESDSTDIKTSPAVSKIDRDNFPRLGDTLRRNSAVCFEMVDDRFCRVGYPACSARPRLLAQLSKRFN